MAAALRRLGVDTEDGVDGTALNATGVAVLLGGGARSASCASHIPRSSG